MGIVLLTLITIIVSLLMAFKMATLNKKGILISRLWLLISFFKILIVFLVYYSRGSALDMVWSDTVEYYYTGISLNDGYTNFVYLINNIHWPPHIGYEILVGILFKLFGVHQIIPPIFNCLIWITASYYFYYLCKYFVSDETALKCSVVLNIYPLIMQYTIYILKDVTIMFLVILSMLNFMRIVFDKNNRNLFYLVVVLCILSLFRTFYTFIIVIWMLIVIILDKKQLKTIHRVSILLIMVIVCLLIGNLVGFENLANIGYTRSEGGLGVFETTTRLEFNSFSSVVGIIHQVSNNIVEFLKYVFRMIFSILLGPTYWFSKSGSEWITKYNRFILFENLGSIFMIILFPGFIYSVFTRKRIIKNKKYIYLFLFLMLIGVVFGGDVRWKLSMMPLIIMISYAGMREFEQNKHLRSMYILMEIMYLVLISVYILI
jgi:4-amino-4-deoxy-L-arabinose transferase-like glycosyltransferase